MLIRSVLNKLWFYWDVLLRCAKNEIIWTSEYNITLPTIGIISTTQPQYEQLQISFDNIFDSCALFKQFQWILGKIKYSEHECLTYIKTKVKLLIYIRSGFTLYLMKVSNSLIIILFLYLHPSNCVCIYVAYGMVCLKNKRVPDLFCTQCMFI